MEILHQRCCGVDVHKKQITACLLVTNDKGRLERKEVKRFLTFTEDLYQFIDWLESNGCQHVAMESTGVYWKPLFNLLESRCIQVCLVNARHMKNVPGRKTDVKDCEWIAQLFRQVLLRPSLIPSAPMRQCRELSRRRKKLIQQRASEINRLQKTLEDANIKLASVATDVTGVSCTRMIQALLEGERDENKLAALAHGTLRRKTPELRKALRGKVQDHHCVLLGQILRHIEFLTEQITEISDDLDRRLQDYQDDIKRLDEMPGVHKTAAQTLIIEMGGDMNVFPSSQHAASWAGVCPGNNESAGKRRSGRNTGGNRWLREILVECANAAARSKDTFLRARYDRLVRRQSKKKAQFAVAHRILEIAYHILKTKQPYRELGGDFYEKTHTASLHKRYVKGLQRRGFSVHLQPCPA